MLNVSVTASSWINIKVTYRINESTQKSTLIIHLLVVLVDKRSYREDRLQDRVQDRLVTVAELCRTAFYFTTFIMIYCLSTT